MAKKHVKVDELSEDQRRMLLSLLEGGAFQLQIDGTPYVVTKRADGAKLVQPIDAAEPYIVFDGKCSCPDCKFREHKCKHLLALEKVC